MTRQVMMAAIRGKVVVCFVLVGWLTPSGLRAQPDAADDKLLARIVADWHKRQERIGCIRYVIRGEIVTPKGCFTDETGRPRNPPMPALDIVKQTDLELLLDPSHQRFRLERDNDSDLDKGLLLPRRTILVFDGQWRRLEIPREGYVRPEYDRGFREPDLFISKNLGARPSLWNLGQDLAPILLAHGLVCQNLSSTSPSFAEKLDPANFRVHGHTLHEGRPCVVLRSNAKKGSGLAEYWVDVARDSAIVRQRLSWDKILRIDCDITYQPSPQGWLPLHWEMVTTPATPSHNPPNIRRLRVERFDLEPKVGPANFTLDAKPGMLVEEFDYAESRIWPKYFQVDFNGEWVETDRSSKTTPHIPLRYWLVCAAVLACCGIRFLMWRRGRRKRFSDEIANELRSLTLPVRQ